MADRHAPFGHFSIASARRSHHAEERSSPTLTAAISFATPVGKVVNKDMGEIVYPARH